MTNSPVAEAGKSEFCTPQQSEKILGHVEQNLLNKATHVKVKLWYM